MRLNRDNINKWGVLLGLAHELMEKFPDVAEAQVHAPPSTGWGIEARVLTADGIKHYYRGFAFEGAFYVPKWDDDADEWGGYGEWLFEEGALFEKWLQGQGEAAIDE